MGDMTGGYSGLEYHGEFVSPGSDWGYCLFADETKLAQELGALHDTKSQACGGFKSDWWESTGQKAMNSCMALLDAYKLQESPAFAFNEKAQQPPLAPVIGAGGGSGFGKQLRGPSCNTTRGVWATWKPASGTRQLPRLCSCVTPGILPLRRQQRPPDRQNRPQRRFPTSQAPTREAAGLVWARG